VVSPSTLVNIFTTAGWGIVDDNGQPSGSVTFVTGPATPPAGTGSARMQLASATAGWFLGSNNAVAAGTRLDVFSQLSYDTYRASVDAGNNLAIALQFNMDYDLTDATVTWQGRLVFEPYQTSPGLVVQDVWQSWNAFTGNWWMSGNAIVGGVGVGQACPQASPCTLATILSNYPDAGIHATLGAIVLKAGSGWNGFDGHVDNLTVTVNAVTTTYDFETA
jgi:hypothetical protein